MIFSIATSIPRAEGPAHFFPLRVGGAMEDRMTTPRTMETTRTIGILLVSLSLSPRLCFCFSSEWPWRSSFSARERPTQPKVRNRE